MWSPTATAASRGGHIWTRSTTQAHQQSWFFPTLLETYLRSHFSEKQLDSKLHNQHWRGQPMRSDFRMTNRNCNLRSWIKFCKADMTITKSVSWGGRERSALGKKSIFFQISSLNFLFILVLQTYSIMF